MLPDIKTKLTQILSTDFDSELPVVYIMSRIRKLLEIGNQQPRFPILNFYCNWTLHAVIKKTEHPKIKNLLLSSINDSQLDFLAHNDLKMEINTFLEQEGLPTIQDSKWQDFKYNLGKSICDTPLIVAGTKYKITFKELINNHDPIFSVHTD